MELRIALLGGVVPAVILGLILLAAGWLARTPRSTPDAPHPGRSGLAGLMLSGWAWVLGFAIAAAFIHYTSWSTPKPWPKDVTARFLHSAGILIAWAAIELVLGQIAAAAASRPFVMPNWSSIDDKPPPRRSAKLITEIRWPGRLLALGAIIVLLASGYLSLVGALGIAIGVVAAAVSVLAATIASDLGQRQHHVSNVWASHFVAALGAAGVLIVGRTATGGQAAAGLAAVAASTAVALLLARRIAPGSIAAFLWWGMLAWVLAMGVYATGHTNIAAALLIMASPLAWAIRRQRLDIDILWRKAPIAVIVAWGWTILCVGAAVTVAVLTQSGGSSGSGGSGGSEYYGY